MRIVSLLPSATELICCIGLRPYLVGVSHGCDSPADVVGLPILTNTVIPYDVSSIEIDRAVRKQLKQKTALYSLDMDVLHTLQPDLIVTQALCEVCAVSDAEIVTAVSQLACQPTVINLEPACLEDVFDTLRLLGDKTNHTQIANDVVAKLKQRVENVHQRTTSYVDKKQYPKVAFFEWLDPLFNAGHWTPELIEIAGGIDCFGNKYHPSETIAWQTVVEAQPEVMFIACCGFSNQRAMRDMSILQSKESWSSLPCVSNKRVYLVDGNAYFNRPGPRLVDSLEMLAHALHPDVHKLLAGVPPASRVLN